METHQKYHKTFEIGDGMKFICVSNRYSAEWEEDGETLLLYEPETDDVWIRISVMAAEPGNISPAKEIGRKVEVAGDKRYLFESQQYEEGGHRVVTCFYDIACYGDKVLISVTTRLENSTTEKFKSVLAEMPGYIASIQETSPDCLFNLTGNDCRYIRKQSADILGIAEEGLDGFHAKDRTLKTIQTFLDEKKFSTENADKLRSLGIAFGDYIRYKYPDFQWTALHDSYGRDYTLKYKQKEICVFPSTMILKRLLDGEKLDVKKLLNALVTAVRKAAERK